jgi:NADH-quinone oxidoreductase subunit F
MATSNRITGPSDLERIKKKVDAQRKPFEFHAMVCSGTPCQACDSLSLKDTLIKELALQGLSKKVRVVESGCMGFCAVGPVMIIYPEGYFYQSLTTDDISELVTGHFKSKKPVKRLMYKDPGSGQTIPLMKDIPYISLQTLFVLHNGGMINPESIEDYIWRDGYQAAIKAFTQLQPREIVDEVKTSGIRGRGGAGFPTGLKWEFCANAKGDIKYMLCNADEGDPGAFMDRSVLESDPHSVLEGMIIAARAIGAHQGYIYCRAEYPLALKRLGIAIQQCHEMGLLGKNLFGTGFDFDLEIYKGAGAFVCGEETALMTSIEGRRGTPRPRPPFPAVSGLWKKPTVLNNVETFSNIPQIILNGGENYAKIGTPSAKGTKIFSLSGKLNNFGLAEVPMGTPIGKVVFDIGGGIINNKKFKAVQLGGPSGGCLPAEHLNLPIEYDAITKAGAIMGSGGMIVMDEDTCMVDMARFFMDFCQDESCGKCTPCRIGTRRMLQILERICHGEGREGDVELLEDIARTIKDTALCGLGQTAPNPVLSTIRYFRDEYDAHIREKRCPAAVCSALFKSPCQHACPVGMDIPAYVALVRAGDTQNAYQVIKQTNPFPAICGRVCGHPCQSKCRRDQLDEALAIKHLKRFVTDTAIRTPVAKIPITRKEKIAVVGAGPSGLSAALELKKRGYAVTVFESLPEAGGMLRWGIPAYRLPHEILKNEIQDILDTGIELKTNTRVGQDISFDTLLKGYDHIYLAAGAQKSSPLGVPGEDSQGVLPVIETLRDFQLGKKVKFGKRVAVIGGGNSAVDAARTALRTQPDSVTIYYRRERKDMPALAEEIKAAEEEGVRLEFLVAPTQVISEKGKVKKLELVRMVLDQFDNSGRKRPKPITGSEFQVDVDTIIVAIGQETDLLFLPEQTVNLSKGLITVDTLSRTSHPRIWAGGDVVTGPAMVIDAIQAGQKTARAIDAEIRSVNREKPWIAPMTEPIHIPFQIEEEPEEQMQIRIRELAASKRNTNFNEVELGYTMEMAISEASRCLRCDGGNKPDQAKNLHQGAAI